MVLNGVSKLQTPNVVGFGMEKRHIGVIGEVQAARNLKNTALYCV